MRPRATRLHAIGNRFGGPAGGPASWTPAALGSSLALWLDAADSSTITLNGSTVSQWNDKSGNARHVSQATAARQPTYTANGLNGKPVLTFNAANPSVMTVPAGQLGGATEASLFWVQQNVNDPAAADINSGCFIANDFGTQIGASNHAPYTDGNVYIQAFNTARLNTGNPTPSLALPRIIGAESTNSLFNFLIDGTVHFTTSTNTYANPSASKNIGTGTPFLGLNFLGTAAELVVVRSILSTTDRQRLEGYLAWKWGLEANLPAGHPFRNSPPTV